jgi:hypothetical protein
MITAKKNKNKKNEIRYVVIGVLCEKLDLCDKWQIEGGDTWAYNWSYKPVTNMFIYDDSTKAEVKKIAEENSLKFKNLFNPMYCSNKLILLIEMLIKKFSL